ncbi:M20/M25/M40 family metallo-hydrolase [Paraglaciecola sp.]|uniref:M20/M25/M40 family metallo-hydrolase n=1 Tax=Paraglaciecola sp. TaxID=1920173 RepID=UPI0030F4AB15
MQNNNNYHVSNVSAAIIGLLIFSTLVLGWLSQKPTDKAYVNNHDSEFSQQRAFAHVNKMASQPHYTGSAGHSDVHDYILQQLTSMGLEVETQNALALSPYYFASTYVANIVARLPANKLSEHTDSKALALVSHYDSAVSSSFGASDAGSGVATILEALRAFIASGQKHSNDIVVIITDAEEIGLLGAQAFVEQHPWAAKIGLALNFEARGSGGTSFMLLETNRGNEALIKAFEQAHVPYPMANSLMYSLYKMLPNDTDLTIFRDQANINGFNFAFIDDHFDYHTAQDTPTRLDPSSLNHQASYLVSLLPSFANIDLSTLNSEVDHVYFNLANWLMVDYPFSWVLPIFILLLLLFIATLIIGLRRKTLTLTGLFMSFLPALTSVLSAGGIGYLCWNWSIGLFPEFLDIPQGFTYSGHWLIGLAILLSIILNAAIYRWTEYKFSNISRLEWLLAPTILWLLINGLIAIHLAGAGFFALMLVAPICALVYSAIQAHKIIHPITYVLLTLPALLVIAPQIPVFVIGLGLSQLFIASLLTSLLLITLLPIWVKLPYFKWQQRTLELVTLVCVIGLLTRTGYSPEQKKPSGFNYLLDNDSGKSVIFSYNPHLDVFTEQVFSTQDQGSELLAGIYPLNPWRKPTFSKAVQVIELAPLNYKATQNTIAENRFFVRILVTPKPTSARFQLATDNAMLIESISVDGQAFATEGKAHQSGFFFTHTVSQDKPVLIEFSYTAAHDVELRLIETRFDLAQVMPGFVPRPAYIMPTPFRLTDATIISEVMRFPLNELEPFGFASQESVAQ